MGTGPRRVRTGDSGVKTHGVTPALGVVGSVSRVYGEFAAMIGHSRHDLTSGDSTHQISVPSGAPNDAPT